MNPLKEVTTLKDLSRVPQPIGPRITVARENMGLSVEQLATRLGVTPASVRAWESDSRTPRANRLLMMAGILDVSITWLLEGREDERMASGGVPSLDEVCARLESAHAMLAEGLGLVESVQRSLAELVREEEDPDPSEVED